ncbi:hypothetical protein [Bombilactobacillus thymidiniphilus]|uniref:TPR repeat-containing protein n=1 Tax=Bombilactobacillus thymidiniphilus TaxID=2923363 RepID=A0ABY4PDE3_9LACO|nr:hypothetical protein [Bombilactobacillus thymidiniphilus]UQS83750.1 hypothetical protein MOO47_00675 [Bombilactobacillus thymidiniphilus]
MDDAKIAQLSWQAQESMAQQDYQSAIELYEEIYKERPQFNFERKMVQALHYNQQDEQAFNLLQSNIAAYLTNITNLALVIDVLVGLHDYIGAQQLLMNSELEHDTAFQQLQTILDYNQASFQQQHMLEQQQLKMRLTTLSTVPSTQQSAIVLKLHSFPVAEFVDCAQFLLLDKKIHPLIKAGIVDDLVKLHLENEFRIDFYGQTRTFISLDCPLISELKCLQSWEKSLLNNDQLLALDQVEPILSEVNLYAALIYPFTDQIVLDPNLWLELILARLNLENKAQSLEKDPKAVKVNKWLDKFVDLLNLFN